MKTQKVNILLPTDFSDNAWSAVVYSLKLYVDKECTFYFLHTTSIIASKISKKYAKDIKENALKELLELKEMAEASSSNANHTFEIVLSGDNLYNAIENEILKHKIDLVIMGTKGATAAKELFFGSNTVNIVKKMRLCPVLIVPFEYDFVEPKQIAFPTDFNRFYNEKELNHLKKLADLFNSEIRIVHIKTENQLNDIQEYNYLMLKHFLKDYKCSYHWMPDYTNKVEEINVFIEDLKINILTMINYWHSLMENLFNEPVIKKIGLQPKVPFLVIPDYADEHHR